MSLDIKIKCVMREISTGPNTQSLGLKQNNLEI